MLTQAEIEAIAKQVVDDEVAKQEALAVQAQTDYEQAVATQREAMKTVLMTEGYSEVPTLEDYKTFFNEPEWFGENWERLATEEYEKATDKMGALIEWYRKYH